MTVMSAASASAKPGEDATTPVRADWKAPKLACLHDLAAAQGPGGPNSESSPNGVTRSS